MIKRNIKYLQISFGRFQDHENSYQLLGNSRLVVKSLSFSGCKNTLDLFLSERYPLLTNFRLYYSSFTHPRLIQFLSRHPQLKALEITGVNDFSVEIITGISELCPNLTSLKLNFLRLLTDGCITQLIAGNLPKLLHLDIGFTSVSEYSSIVNILKAFPLLKSLSMSGCELSLNTIMYYLNSYADPRLVRR
jgi:hypothetical protein